jgi:hypothetical protein
MLRNAFLLNVVRQGNAVAIMMQEKRGQSRVDPRGPTSSADR